MTIILSHKRNSTHDYLDFKYITLCIRYCIETVHVTNITQGIFCYPSYNLVVSNLYNYQLSGINLLFNFQPSCIACVYVSTKQIFLNLLCLLFLFFFFLISVDLKNSFLLMNRYYHVSKYEGFSKSNNKLNILFIYISLKDTNIPCHSLYHTPFEYTSHTIVLSSLFHRKTMF